MLREVKSLEPKADVPSARATAIATMPQGVQCATCPPGDCWGVPKSRARPSNQQIASLPSQFLCREQHRVCAKCGASCIRPTAKFPKSVVGPKLPDRKAPHLGHRGKPTCFSKADIAVTDFFRSDYSPGSNSPLNRTVATGPSGLAIRLSRISTSLRPTPAMSTK